MDINGTLINYYFHCKRQCYLHAHRLNLEDNSEQVKIGKALHEEKAMKQKNAEIAVGNIRLDRLTTEYLTEIKKSDADPQAAKWQLIYYLKILKEKGVIRKGRLEFVEKNKSKNKIIYLELTDSLEKELQQHIQDIRYLLADEKIPSPIESKTCKKCAYYEYCYI